jgi:NAD(P)-dependent dehydrogenase (short-subunit alcohol dehydrogenase family)
MTIVITGAARGMGRACIDRLRGSGTRLVAVDLARPEIDGAIGVACDVSDPAAVEDLVAEVRELGAFRALIHAAGISPTMGEPRRILEVDLVGTQLLLDAFELLVGPGTAAVCFASSAAHQIGLLASDHELEALVRMPLAPGFLDRAAALLPDPGLAYAWAKRGVIRAASRAAVAWGARGGRVNSLSPGLIDTPMNEQELAAQPMMQTMLEHTPLARLGDAAEVAAVAAFLVSDDASFLSGTDVLVDGGMFQGFRTLFESDTGTPS